MMNLMPLTLIRMSFLINIMIGLILILIIKLNKGVKTMKIKEKLKAHASKIAAAVTGGAVMIAGAVPALAADGSNLTEDFKTALSTAFSTVKSDAVSLMTLALPAALAIMGIVIAIKLGIKFFKKFSNG